MMRSARRLQPPPAADVAWLSDAPLNSYELDMLSNELREVNLQRQASGSSASVSQAKEKSVHRQTMSEKQRGLLATNAGRSGFLEAQRSARGPFTLSNLCIGLLGSSIEDLMEELDVLGEILPQTAKAPLIAIARRRSLFNDKILIALADETFEVLDVSGMSQVTDAGMLAVAGICKGLRAVDIRCCPNISSISIEALVRQCPEIHTLRMGGDLASHRTAQRSLKHLIPHLRPLGDSPSWEEVNVDQAALGAGALDWLLWPSIDEAFLIRLNKEFPRVCVNPKPRRNLPYYARLEEPLDGPLLDGFDPRSWADSTTHKPIIETTRKVEPLAPIAERFRLAYVARFERTAAKRAKNERQRERRAEKDFLAKDVTARARSLANMVR